MCMAHVHVRGMRACIARALARVCVLDMTCAKNGTLFMLITLLPSYVALIYWSITCKFPYVSVCTRMLLVCYSSVLICYSYVLVWCFSDDLFIVYNALCVHGYAGIQLN